MYLRFFAMVATSTVAMFGLMYLHVHSLEHVVFSETRLWMALAMGACMAGIMLGFMTHMLDDTRKNVAILAGAAVVFGVSVWLVRSQRTIDDLDYMRAMIPHHSIAILTSERAQLRDPRTRRLAQEIIEAQRREIDEMKQLIADIEERGVQGAPGTARR